MVKPIHSATAVCAILAATVLTAACSSSGTDKHVASGATAGGAQSTGSGPATTAAAKSAATSGKASATCKQLTAAQIQPFDKAKVTSVKVEPAAELNNKGQLCLFSGSDDVLTVEVAGGALAQQAYAQATASVSKPVAVPGVGDKAIRDGSADSSAVDALHGDVYCHVDMADYGDIPGASHLYDENGHHTEIGQPAFLLIANALGTVCNRVFGSGNTTPALAGLATMHISSAPSAAIPTSFSVPTDATTS